MVLLMSCVVLSGHAQNHQWDDSEEVLKPFDGLRYCVEAQATVSDGQTPLWLNANHYGLSSLEKTNGYLRTAVFRPLSQDSLRQWGLGYGLDLAGTYHHTANPVVHQAFVELRWLHGTITVGSKEQPMQLKNNRLSTGSQTLGINARPVPQVRLSLDDYWCLPFANDWLQLKGHIAYGRFTDDNWQEDFTHGLGKRTKGALYHSKAGYLKIGNEYQFCPLSLELGLEMASQFGGTTYIRNATATPDSPEKVIVNEGGLSGMWHAFLPGGGETVEMGTAYENASGNQLGSWLARLNYDGEWCYLGFYAEHYFEDHSSMLFLDYDGYGSGAEWNVKKKRKFFLYDLKDVLLGFDFRLKNGGWLDNVLLEYMYTKYQSGPIYHDHTQRIFEHVSGMDNYYNHYIFTGWQHWGQAMGNPLYRSPLYNENGVIEFQDNRFTAWHLGLSGSPFSGLNYRVLATLRHGFGTYAQPYISPKDSQHFLVEANYRFSGSSQLDGWYVKTAVGADFGQVYGKNLGCQLTIGKTGLLNMKRQKR